MPFAPKRPCTWPGCGALTDNGRCEKHKRQERHEIYLKRGSPAKHGYDRKWQNARKRFLNQHQFCNQCEKHGRGYVAATVVDHIKPHKGDMKLFWDEDNWQPLCKPCHDSKTAREGRWG